MERMTGDMALDVHQNGGQQGRSTIDNLMAVMVIQQEAKQRETFIVFADAYKCFDRLWLKDQRLPCRPHKRQWREGGRNEPGLQAE